MGTFETKFVIPDLTAEQDYLPISSVVLSSQRENLAAAVGSAERDKKLLAANPLIQDNQKLIPSVTRVFRKDQDMYVYLEAYQPGAEKTELMVATVSFFRGRVKAFETAPLKITAGLNAKSKAVPVALQRAARQVTAGAVHLPGKRARSLGAEVRGLAVAGSAAAVRSKLIAILL